MGDFVMSTSVAVRMHCVHVGSHSRNSALPTMQSASEATAKLQLNKVICKVICTFEIALGIDVPELRIRWSTSRAELAALPLKGEWVNNDYYVFCATVFGQAAKVGVHYCGAHIAQFEIMPSSADISQSYESVQHHLEEKLGRSHEMGPADGKMDYHEWRFGGVRIVHTVVERFVMYEVVMITRSL